MVGHVRLRMVFGDAALLSGSQRRQGLQRCWLLLRPDLKSIADLASQIRQTFGLHRSSPHGLVISMDDFVLPPFESTLILKDEDMIMINKSEFIFTDPVEFCASQNQERVLQSRETLVFNNRSLARAHLLGNSEGDDDPDTVLCDGSAGHEETPSNEKINAQGKRKHSNNIQDSDYNLEDSHGDSLRYEEDIYLHGNMAHKEVRSSEMKNKKYRKKHTDKIQTSVTLESKDFLADRKRGKVHFILPFPHKGIWSKMIRAKRRIKHSDKHRGPNDTLAIEESHVDSQKDGEEVGHHANTTHKEAAPHKLMRSKRKRKHSNKLQASVTLRSTKSKVDSQGNQEDLGLLNGSTSHQEIPSFEFPNTKRKRKCSNRHQGPDDILAIEDSSSGDSKGNEENAGAYGNLVHNEARINEMMNANHKKNHPSKHQTSDTLAVGNYQEDAPGDDKDVEFSSGNVVPTVIARDTANVIKRRHYNKLEASKFISTGNDDGHEYDADGDAKKVESRSVGRKKAKRRWRRTHVSQSSLIEIQIPENGNQQEALEYANADQNTNLDKDIVPAIVRPGHIRFETSDESSTREDELVETFQWNGTTNKKKGQKWGREKSYNKWNDDTSDQLCNGDSNDKEVEAVECFNEKAAVDEVETSEDFITEQVDPVTVCGSVSGNKLKVVEQLINYETFPQLIRLPMEGDTLIYRVVELSSSWCPELSPFRVGRVSSYDSSSSKVILLPLPEYPLVSEEMSEEWHETSSLYKEDGTLEIDFPFLLDVRLIKARESGETASISPIKKIQDAAPDNNQGSEVCSDHTMNVQQLSEGWEEINRAIDRKKAQLQKQKNLDKRNSCESTAIGPWSYKALRRNALGPTLAMLRSSDGELI